MRSTLALIFGKRIDGRRTFIHCVIARPGPHNAQIPHCFEDLPLVAKAREVKTSFIAEAI